MNAGINLLLRWDHVPVVAHNPDISSIYRWPYFSSFFLFSFQLKLCYSYNTKVGVRNYQQLCGTHNMMVLTGYSFWYVNRNNFKRMSIKKRIVGRSSPADAPKKSRQRQTYFTYYSITKMCFYDAFLFYCCWWPI